MKNSTRLLFWLGGLTLLVLLIILLIVPFVANAQTAVTAPAGGGFFSKIGSWVKDNLAITVITFVGGIFTNKGWTARAKRIAHKGAIVLKGMGHLLSGAGNVLEQFDTAIREDDTIDAKGILDAIKNSKPIYIEGEEFYMSIKPKKPVK